MNSQNFIIIATTILLFFGCGDDPMSHQEETTSDVVELSSSQAFSSSSIGDSASIQPIDSIPIDEEEVCSSEQGIITFNNECIKYNGRHLKTDSEVSFDWPASGVEAYFTGTSLKIVLSGHIGVYFDIFLNGELLAPITQEGESREFKSYGTLRTFSNSAFSYSIAENLSPGRHHIRLVKRSETASKAVNFIGFELDENNHLLQLPSMPPRKIEFIGDSYIVGYGNESPSKTDPNIQDASGRTCSNSELEAYTNSNKAYGPLISQHFEADFQVNAYSGLGMTRHYSGNTSYLPFQDYYERTLVSIQQSMYDSQNWIPDVVVIALGTNDFSTDLGDNDYGIYIDRDDLYLQYREKYHTFLNLLRSRYPGVKIIAIANNLWPDDEMKTQVTAIVEEEKSQGHSDIYYKYLTNTTGYGCGWHPDLQTHQRWADELSIIIADIMNW